MSEHDERGPEAWDEVPEIEHDPPVPPDRPRTERVLPDSIGPAVDALPGLARVAASAWWHTTEWGVRTSARTGRRMVRAVADPGEAAALARDATEAAAVVSELARSVTSGVPLHRALLNAGESLGELAEPPETQNGRPKARQNGRPDGGSARPDGSGGHANGRAAGGADLTSLRERGAELLERSRDVWNEDTAHPAYERILDDLAPDEARILLLLLQGGPQPSVDVRTGGPIGMVNSQLVAPGLTMIGARAGCRYLDQVPSYLNNLFRLGLVWFSREALRDPMEYQVVEAQPDVLEAVHSVKFAKVVRRSIHLTPFGEDFCRTCLVEEGTVDAAPFPAHSKPPEGDAGEPPGQA